MNLIHVLKNILFYPLVDPVILPNHLLLPRLHYPFVDYLVSIASPCMIFFFTKHVTLDLTFIYLTLLVVFGLTPSMSYPLLGKGPYYHANQYFFYL